jgi:hypothetical protein
MYDFYEPIEPERSDAALAADYVAAIIECADQAPPLDWMPIEQIRLDALDNCYCSEDCLCGPLPRRPDRRAHRNKGGMNPDKCSIWATRLRPARSPRFWNGRASSRRFNRSRILAPLLPPRASGFATLAFVRPLGAFLAGLAFFPDFALAGATGARLGATRAFLFGFGVSPAVVAGAVPVSSVVDVIISHSPLAVITAFTT